jgi:hypothetical protein
MVLTVSYLTLLNHQATQIHGDKLTGDHMIELHPKKKQFKQWWSTSPTKLKTRSHLESLNTEKTSWSTYADGNSCPDFRQEQTCD